MQGFSAATRDWFESAFGAPTAVQQRGWDAIAAGKHALLIAPTGSGKTLAAFLWCIDKLCRPAAEADAAARGIRVLYVSPLKALVHDVERNLQLPLAGIRDSATRAGSALHVPRVSLRTGDTSPKQRREQARDPGEILVTTPESLYLLLGSRAREHLRSVEAVIVDEVHALAGEKRGAHLALSLERLAQLCAKEPQRIGLSATAKPLGEIARFLGGDREVAIVDASARPRIDLQIRVPVRDMSRPDDPETQRAADGPKERGLWPLIVPQLLEQIRQHRSTIVFTNSRGLCERLAHRINELAGEPLVRAHHGSLAHGERAHIEGLLKRGELAGIVATSSLELGIDMGAVDLVLLVESPGSVARGLQRVGRAGHGVGQISKGRLYPKHRADLLEASVIARGMGAGAIEALRVPDNPLDVLAQQIVAMVAVEDWELTALERLVRRSANFRNLPHDALIAVLDLLAGRYPSHEFRGLQPRLVWDRERDLLRTRRGAGLVALVNGGTIPDRGLYGVYLGEGGPRLGELDEEMVHETMPGEVFALGASSFRVDRITLDRVIVSAAPGEPGKLPFWRGEGPGRPIELGRALGAFVRELAAREPDAAAAWLEADYGLDRLAARNLIAYLDEQRELTGCLPTDRAITVERFRDELGEVRVCILSPFGARVHAPWALAIESRFADQATAPQTVYNDDGIVLRFAGGEAPAELEALLVPDPDELSDLLQDQLANSALFAALFRENAARALLLPRRHPNARVPLFLQRRRSAELLAVAREYPAFPIILETYRSCLQDVFDVPALRELLGAIKRREVRIDAVDTQRPSPFAQGLAFAYVADNLYEGDAPLAERRAQALTLDQGLLRELLGEAALRELLDPEIIAEVERELQGLQEDRRARSHDALHDRLRRVGDLRPDEVAARCEGEEAQAWLEALVRERRAVLVRVAGELRAVAVEDAALYRDALGSALPAAVPAAFLEPEPDPLAALLARYARTHGPFTEGEAARRLGAELAAVAAALQAMVARGALVRGELRPGGEGAELCDPELLRRIKRRTLARLRGEASAAPSSALVRFLPAWHGIARGGEGALTLVQAIARLEGLPIPFGELERTVLPARVPDFSPNLLDELGATGVLVWVGAGALPGGDGKVRLFLREHAVQLLDPVAAPADLGALPRSLLAHLEQRGASFFTELVQAAATPTDAVLSALRELLWAGLVTNDTFRPLRVLAAPRSKSPRQSARQTKNAASGRFALVRDLVRARASDTERAHARALKLLERHGLCTREVADLEELPGGFASLYRVFSALEELGKIRRGYFVESLGGAQFAFPGAIDRLRALQSEGGGPAIVLAAVDPANPFGWLLPWPNEGDAEGSGGKPRRVPNASVVIAGGELVLYLGNGGKHMLTFAAARDPERLAAAVEALRASTEQRRGKFLRVELIDGRPAQGSELAPQLLALQWKSAYRGLELEAR